jgi:hypothetical protein
MQRVKKPDPNIELIDSLTFVLLVDTDIKTRVVGIINNIPNLSPLQRVEALRNIIATTNELRQEKIDRLIGDYHRA